MPMYSQNQYLVYQPTANALVGGKSHVTISLFFFRITLFFDLIGAKFAPSMTMKYDTVEYNEFCLSSEWVLDVLKFLVTLNLDVKECDFGILAMFLPGDFENCEWKNYYVDYPIY